MQYFFVLGRNPQLSLAELYATLPKGWQPLIFGGQILVAQCREFEVNVLMKRLGGTIKIGKVLENSKQKIENRILDLLTAKTGNRKLFFGLSAYALDEKVQLPNIRQLRQLGIGVKRALQAQGYKVRLVTSKEIALSSVIVKQEKLLTQGAEIVLFYGTPRARGLSSVGSEVEPPDISIGQTLAVQEFGEASARDFGRPVRSMGVGMLPVQLAKIMLNLSRATKQAVILDPFCGLGTILTEAVQMGYLNLIGSDLEQKMVEATRENLDWLRQKSEIRNPKSETNSNGQNPKLDIKLLQSPAEQISKHLPPRSVDAIVTEPYMGPTREIRNPKSEIRNLIELYVAAFSEFAKILKLGGKVVFIFPAFVTKRRASSFSDDLIKTSDNVLPKIKKLGFKPIPLLLNHPIIKLSNYPTTSITYSRPDQRVRREIFVLEYQTL